MSVGNFLESEAGFVWVEVAGVRVYSCYFSPNDPFEVFETQLLLFEESLSEAVLTTTLTVGRPSDVRPASIGGEYWLARWSLGMT